MLPALLALPLLLPAVDDARPTAAAADSTELAGELELVTVLGTTRLDLVNPSADAAVVRVHDGDDHALITLIVPARGTQTFVFPRHTLAGTSLQVIALGPFGPSSSGLLEVEGIVGAGYRTVWFESTRDALHAFGQRGSEPDPIEATAAQPSPAGPHVPVINPNNRPSPGDRPPRIEPKPLPPV